jgi:NDP-sugar pyrophosphorylase family protein
MVLAAGLGTRLRPLTDDRPKALVEVGGRTMLELTLAKLKRAGVREAIVNTHHYAEMIEEYLRANDGFGMRIEVSREDTLLATGGGLKKAAWFFLEGHAEGGGQDEPFLVHNVDVLSTIDLSAMVRAHRESKALATLAVMERETSRYLLFDGEGRLAGRRGVGGVAWGSDRAGVLWDSRDRGADIRGNEAGGGVLDHRCIS